jgi:hypothetical protein
LAAHAREIAIKAVEEEASFAQFEANPLRRHPRSPVTGTLAAN